MKLMPTLPKFGTITVTEVEKTKKKHVLFVTDENNNGTDELTFQWQSKGKQAVLTGKDRVAANILMHKYDIEPEFLAYLVTGNDAKSTFNKLTRLMTPSPKPNKKYTVDADAFINTAHQIIDEKMKFLTQELFITLNKYQ